MNPETAVETSLPQTRGPSAGTLVAVGLLATLAGGVSYFLLLTVPWIRNYAVPNIALVIIGTALCFRAVSKKRSKLVISGTVLSSLVAVGFLLSLFVLMRLPAPQKSFAVGDELPDFTLPNQDERDVTLSDYRGRGPVLLVFYRGFW